MERVQLALHRGFLLWIREDGKFKKYQVYRSIVIESMDTVIQIVHPASEFEVRHPDVFLIKYRDLYFHVIKKGKRGFAWVPSDLAKGHIKVPCTVLEDTGVTSAESRVGVIAHLIQGDEMFPVQYNYLEFAIDSSGLLPALPTKDTLS